MDMNTLKAEARETVRAAASDLDEVAERLPVPDDRVEQVARILDRLSEELTEAAGMLRRTALRQVGQGMRVDL
ncbi:MAG TPA: hypothetical protein VMV92_40235 [Streptosporangiaceae bacterium]|nr:hypothetical protein [Streptosporangiaceae bacterium]